MPTPIAASRPPAPVLMDLGPFRDDVVAQVRSQLADVIVAAVCDALRGALGEVKVSVAAPVTVTPPNVNVAAPAVTVTPRVDVPALDLSGLDRQLTRIEDAVGRVAALLAAPVTRTVTRDRDGRIVSMTEKRGI